MTNWKIMKSKLWLVFVQVHLGRQKWQKRRQKLDYEDKNRIWWGQNWDFEDKYWLYMGQGHIWDIKWTYSGHMWDMGQSVDKSRDTYIVNQHQMFFLSFLFRCKAHHKQSGSYAGPSEICQAPGRSWFCKEAGQESVIQSIIALWNHHQFMWKLTL